MSRSINEWAREVHGLAVSKGWHERPMRADNGDVNVDAVAAKLMLIVSEVSEALECLRDSKATILGAPGPNHDLSMWWTSSGKPEGFDVELADTIIRILDLAEALGLDIEKAMETKHAYNASRGHRHGGKTL